MPTNWNSVYFLDADLRLISKVIIDYPLLDFVQKWNTSKYSIPDAHSIWLCNLTASAKAFEGKIFVLLNVPRLEILGISEKGEIISHFYSEDFTRDMNWIDFVIDRMNNSIVFYILCNSIGSKGNSGDFIVYRLSEEGR